MTDSEFKGLLDREALQAWMVAQGVFGKIDTLSIERVTGGASNIIFRVEAAGKRYALRRPPRVVNDKTSDTILREVKLLKALGPTAIPHARLVAACEDVSVIGVPFAMLEWINGFTPMDPLPAPFDQPDAALRTAMAHELIDALAAIANTDWQIMGLDGFGKPDGFLERQVQRWISQLERYRIRDIPLIDDVAAWLTSNQPTMQRSALMHGDYQFINVMFVPTAPARLAAVIDWESATIGDPLLDLGHLLSGWRDPSLTQYYVSPYIDWRAFPPRTELAARYAEKTGLSVAKLDYYMALALFRLGIIMEGAYARHVNGAVEGDMYAQLEQVVPNMIREAARIINIG